MTSSEKKEFKANIPGGPCDCIVCTEKAEAQRKQRTDKGKKRGNYRRASASQENQDDDESIPDEPVLPSNASCWCRVS